MNRTLPEVLRVLVAGVGLVLIGSGITGCQKGDDTSPTTKTVSDKPAPPGMKSGQNQMKVQQAPLDKNQ